MKKKAMSSTAVNLIIFLVILFGLVFFGARVFLYANNQTQSSACSLGTLTTNGADALKKTGFFTTYEINCKAVHHVWTLDLLRPNSVTAEAAIIEPEISKLGKDIPEREQLVLKDKIAEQLETCWKITGNRQIVDIKYTSAALQDSVINQKVPQARGATESITNFWFNYDVIIGDAQREANKVLFFQRNLGYTVTQQTISERFLNSFTSWFGGNGGNTRQNLPAYLDLPIIQSLYNNAFSPSYANMPAVACMVCSTNHFAEDVSLPASIDMKSYLEKKPFTGGNNNLWAILSAKKGDYPKQTIYGNVDNSVIYYQFYEQPDQEFDMSRLGVMVLPTQSIPNFCDVMLNRG